MKAGAVIMVAFFLLSTLVLQSQARIEGEEENVARPGGEALWVPSPADSECGKCC